MTKEKAILISTGEEVEITSSYGIKMFSLSIDIELGNIELSDTNSRFVYNNSEHDTEDEGWFYILSNGLKVSDDEVITDKNDIRDYKIDKLNGI